MVGKIFGESLHFMSLPFAHPTIANLILSDSVLIATHPSSFKMVGKIFGESLHFMSFPFAHPTIGINCYN
jgi:hypothetical protein